MLSWILAHAKNWFAKKQNPTSRPRLKELRVGNLVEIRFRDPRKMGLVDPSGVLTKRYDPEDLDTMTLTGMVTNIFVNCNMQFIELTVTKVVNGLSKTRLYTLMEDDIANIKVIK